MTKLVVTRGANGRRMCYHTDPECTHLKGNTTREVTDREIQFHDLSECCRCAGNTAHKNDDTEWKEFTTNLRNGNIDV